MEIDKINCDICKKVLKIKEKEIQGGKCLKFKEEEEEFFVIRCNECFAKNKGLRNFRKCEVYSRVVGYLRPVRQWNPGKQQEFKERVNYKK